MVDGDGNGSENLNALDMEYNDSHFSERIKQNIFPAKLWHLTNDPQNISVFWGPSGESLMVDQQRFEADLRCSFKQDTKLFRTSNFNSFIRQLNLYGFRRIPDGPPREKFRNLHHFHSPFFKRGQPELLVHLKRNTCSKGSKIQSHLRQKPKHSTTYENRGSTQLFGVGLHQQEFEQSPMPGYPLNFLYTDGSYFYSNIPPSANPYATAHWVQLCPTILIPQEIPHHLSHPAAVYKPAFQCCTSERRTADQAGGYQTSLPYSHYAFYPNYFVRHQQSSLQMANYAERQSSDINLDRVFQVADELQEGSDVHKVRVGNPVKTSSLSPHTLPAASTAQPSSPQGFKMMAFSPQSEPDEYQLYIDKDYSNKDPTKSESD